MAVSMRAWLGIVCLAGFALGVSTPTPAGTIRHDDQDHDGDAPDDHLYLDLAKQYPSVGWFNNSSGSGSSCSWTLIGSEWALTAAHCFDSGGNPDNLSFRLGSPDWGTQAEHTRGASRVYAHPEYQSGALNLAKGWDIALVRLDNAIEAVEPSRVNRTQNESGQIITAVGYGQTGTGQGAGSDQPAGTKRAGRNAVDDRRKQGRLLVMDFDSPSNPDLNQLGASSPIYLEYNTAPGDSGGPGFLNVNGEQRVAGVVSFSREGDVVFGGVREDNYGELDFQVAVRQFDHWIDATVTQYGNEKHWTGGSGDFFDSDNWNADAGASVEDTAVFNRDATYTVRGGTAVMRRMVVRDGNVTYDTEGSVVYADYDPRNEPPGEDDPSESVIVGVTELDDPTLRITGGGPFQPWRVRIAELPGSFGRVEVDRGSELRGNRISVGYGGDGEVDLDHATLVPVELRIGNNSGATGEVTATNNATVHVDTLVAGHYGRGTLELDGGSTLQTDDWAVIARHPSSDSSGVALNNATWNASHEVRIGQGAFGFVQVRNGSNFDASGQQVYLGVDHVQGVLLGGGSMTIRDPGSRFEAGDWILGWGDTGAAGIRNGGFASVNNLILGGQNTGDGDLTVDGGGLTVGTNAFIGLDGEGEATISGAGEVTVNGRTTIADGAAGTGHLTITGGEAIASVWRTGELTVGRAGEGELIIENGGRLNVSAETHIARETSSVGSRIVVRGDGSEIDADDIAVGETGIGGLVVEQRAAAVFDRVVVGKNIDSLGQLTFSDATIQADVLKVGDEGLGFATIKEGAKMTGDSAKIGFNSDGSGLLNIESGAAVTLTRDMAIGALTEARGTVNVRGFSESADGITPSALTVNGTFQGLVIGKFGTGAMNVGNGARVTVADNVRMGKDDTGEGRLLVGGSVTGIDGRPAPATISVDGSMLVGMEGRATVTVQRGGLIDVQENVVIGNRYYNSPGRLIMEGGTLEAGSLRLADHVQLDFRHDFKDGLIRVIGNDGSGTFRHDATNLHVDGTLTGGVARLELANGVEGDLDGHDLVVGNGHEGRLTVRNGATLDPANTTIGWTDDAIGYLSVENGSMPHTGDFTAGRAGTATVGIRAGGRVAVAGDATLADLKGSSVEMTVSGTASVDLLTRRRAVFEVAGDASGASGAIDIGRRGEASLTISSGGKVEAAGDVRLAAGADSSASVNVSGLAEGPIADLYSRLDVGGDLILSQRFDANTLIDFPVPSGDASLSIGPGGVVDVEGRTNLGTFQSAGAALNVNGGSLYTRGLNARNGSFAFSSGEVHIEGGELRGLAGNDFTLGALFANGMAHLELTDGATFDLHNAKYDSNGNMTDPGDKLTVGGGQLGRMDVLGGSSVTSGRAVIGDAGDIVIIPISDTLPLGYGGESDPRFPAAPQYDGQVTVEGENSLWTIGDNLEIGQPTSQAYEAEFANTGRLRVRDGGRVAVTHGVTVNPGSMLDLDGGRVDGEGVFLHPGVTAGELTEFNPVGQLRGSGAVGGHLFNLGVVDIGRSPGLLTVEGDYRQYLSIGDFLLKGLLAVELGGHTPGDQFDLLQATGAARLGGVLSVGLIDNFEPEHGDEFVFMEAAGIIGTFNELRLPNMPGGLTFEVVYGTSDVSLVVVPEPSAWLLALPAVGLGLLRRARPTSGPRR